MKAMSKCAEWYCLFILILSLLYPLKVQACCAEHISAAEWDVCLGQRVSMFCWFASCNERKEGEVTLH